MIGTDYSLTISDDALNDLQNYIDYIIYQYQDYFVVAKIYEDFQETVQKLRIIGDSIEICNFPSAQRNKIRKIRLKKYSFYLFYIIDGNNIEIIRGFHSWRNYQKYL